MQDLQRMRYVTRYYEALKGLQSVPFGAFFLLMATRDLGWTWLGAEGDCTYTLPLILLTIGFYFLANRYYARNFGTITPFKKASSFLSIIVLVVVFFLLIGLEFWVRLPLSLVGLAIAGYFLFDGYKSRRYYYLLSGLAMLAASLMPLLLGVPISDRVFGSFGLVMKVVLGLVIIAAGLIDHFRLVQSFPSLQEENHVRPA